MGDCSVTFNAVQDDIPRIAHGVEIFLRVIWCQFDSRPPDGMRNTIDMIPYCCVAHKNVDEKLSSTCMIVAQHENAVE